MRLTTDKRVIFAPTQQEATAIKVVPLEKVQTEKGEVYVALKQGK